MPARGIRGASKRKNRWRKAPTLTGPAAVAGTLQFESVEVITGSIPGRRSTTWGHACTRQANEEDTGRRAYLRPAPTDRADGRSERSAVPEVPVPSARAVARRVRTEAWLAGWAVKDRLADAGRRVPEGSVALTFDDGPHPSSTPRVLDVLGELGVTATFFVVGRNVRAHPELVARTVAEGHRVGSHSCTHPHPAETPLRTLAEEYRSGRQALAEVVGGDTPLFRPPNGHLAVRSALMVRRQGLAPWLWTVDPQDWRPGVSAEEVARVAREARSTDVVLMHDWVERPWDPRALDRSATVAAIPAVVRAVRQRGLDFTVLPG
jgi:peptidoglycan/xylan/chitin deacetylase (PgdA/CDA1 family)